MARGCGAHAANHREVRLVQLCFDFYMIEAKPENLIGDRAYDSDPLGVELRKDGIEMIAPHRRPKGRSEGRGGTRREAGHGTGPAVLGVQLDGGGPIEMGRHRIYHRSERHSRS
jgi:hypothetical protein